MPHFAAADEGGVRVSFDDQEATILRRLLDELRDLLTDDPDRQAFDPVIKRLYPDAYEDIGDEYAFRELVGDDLENSKLQALEAVSTAMGKKGPATVEINGDDVTSWLSLLTDLRLAIGTRLDVDEERMAAEVDPNDRDAPALTLMHWLGWIQEEILSRVMDDV